MSVPSKDKKELYRKLKEAAVRALRSQKVDLKDATAIATAINATSNDGRLMTETAVKGIFLGSKLPATNTVGKLKAFIGNEATAAIFGEQLVAKRMPTKNASVIKSGKRGRPAKAATASTVTLILAGNTFHFDNVPMLRKFLDSLQG